jgi:hypothetical protein
MGQLRIMDRSGDIKLEWDGDKKAEVTVAEKAFNDNVGKGFLAYRVYDGGKKGEQLKKFDATAEKIIMVPPVTGG